LPNVDAVFTLVRRLASRSPVTDVAAPKWLVQRHGLAPLAARGGLAQFRDDLVRATVDWALMEAELTTLVPALRKAGVRVAPIKGASYAKHEYAHPAERPMSDLDLLVPAASRRDAEGVLRSLGFELSPAAALMHHAVPFVRGSFAIDLHWNIIGPGRARVALEDVWARMTPGWPAGAERLNAIDALVFHLVHLARNRLRLPLVNIVDCARLVERASPALAIERAREWGLQVPVSLAWRLCASVLENRRGKPAGWLGPSYHELLTLTPPTPKQKLLFDVATAGSAAQLGSRVAHIGINKLRAFVRR
jgi:hypothetical protein